jgi:hypothetical protein
MQDFAVASVATGSPRPPGPPGAGPHTPVLAMADFKDEPFHTSLRYTRSASGSKPSLPQRGTTRFYGIECGLWL